MKVKSCLLALAVVCSGPASAQNSKNDNSKVTIWEASAIAGRTSTFGETYSVDTACVSTGWVEIIVVVPPKSGKFEIIDTSAAMSYTKENPRFVCNGKQVAAKAVSYTPLDQFEGADTMTLERITSNGNKTRVQYKITVRKLDKTTNNQ